jgi:hypothetical protein
MERCLPRQFAGRSYARVSFEWSLRYETDQKLRSNNTPRIIPKPLKLPLAASNPSHQLRIPSGHRSRGEFQTKNTALAGLTLYRDRAAMLRDNPVRNGQA